MSQQNRRPNHAILLLITVISTTAAVLMMTAQSPVNAQSGAQATVSSDVIALPVNIRGNDAIALIDKSQQTICLYQYQPQLPLHRRFELLAARSYKFDMQLTDYNNAEPRPTDVEKIIQQAQMMQRTGESESSTPDATRPKDDAPR